MKSKTSQGTGVTFRLNEPGMSEYERAGLAGLYLSLTAAKAWENQQKAWPLPESVGDSLAEVREVDWDIDESVGIHLEWGEEDGAEKKALEAIVKWAWQVHDGVLFLPGIHRKREHLDCYYLRPVSYTHLTLPTIYSV